MSFRNSITIVASPRPRVGKTLLARLLTDFHLQEGRTVAAFDLNSGEHTLAQFLPERVVTAKIRDINGQMALFDRLVADDDATKVVDLGHESFESFFAVAHQIGFAEEARRRSIALAILFVVTPDQTSVEAYRNLRARFAQATLAPVHNEMLGSAQHRDKYMLAGSGARAGAFAGAGAGLAQIYRQAAIFIRKFENGQRGRYSARHAYRIATLAAANLSGVPGTRSAHIAGRSAVFDPHSVAIDINLRCFPATAKETPKPSFSKIRERTPV